MTTIADLENGILSYFTTQWGTRTDINWTAQNASYETTKVRTGFTDNETYIVPRLQQASASSAEFPVSEGGRTLSYQFNLNLVTKPHTGVSITQGHLAQLRSIFELKTLTISNATLQFEMLRTTTGFLSETGDAFEVPCSIFFETTIFPT